MNPKLDAKLKKLISEANQKSWKTVSKEQQLEDIFRKFCEINLDLPRQLIEDMTESEEFKEKVLSFYAKTDYLANQYTIQENVEIKCCYGLRIMQYIRNEEEELNTLHSILFPEKFRSYKFIQNLCKIN